MSSLKELQSHSLFEFIRIEFLFFFFSSSRCDLDLNQPLPQTSLEAICVTQWETNAADFGLSIIHAHLDSIRNFNNNLPLYRRNAQIVLSDCSRIDELLEDSFRLVTFYHYIMSWPVCLFKI